MRRQRSMLMPRQVPSSAFIAKGGATFVPMTSSRASGGPGVWARAGGAWASTAARATTTITARIPSSPRESGQTCEDFDLITPIRGERLCADEKLKYITVTVNIKDVAETLVRKVTEFRTAGELHMRARGAALDRNSRGTNRNDFIRQELLQAYTWTTLMALDQPEPHALLIR